MYAVAEAPRIAGCLSLAPASGGPTTAAQFGAKRRGAHDHTVVRGHALLTHFSLRAARVLAGRSAGEEEDDGAESGRRRTTTHDGRGRTAMKAVGKSPKYIILLMQTTKVVYKVDQKLSTKYVYKKCQ